MADFARKTGDFASLSLTDMRLLALTYQLEVRTMFIGWCVCEREIERERERQRDRETVEKNVIASVCVSV